MKERVSFNKTSIKALKEKAANGKKKEAGAMLVLRRLSR